MTVKELIEELKRYPDTFKVVLFELNEHIDFEIEFVKVDSENDEVRLEYND